MLFLSFGALTSLVSSAAAFNATGGSLRARHALHDHYGKRYSSVDYYKGEDFFNDMLWTFSTSADPTGGQVNYLSGVDAQEEGLAYVQPDGSAVLRVDDWTDLPFGAPRNSCVVPAKVRGGPRASNAITSTNYSVRISSMKPFDYGLVVADFAFMPFGCSVWPAFWASGPNWPDNGEIDIVEGVNLKSSNRFTFHTGPNQECSVPSQAPIVGGDPTFTADVLNTNCSSSPTSDTGCSFYNSSEKSFGQGFNDAGGGVFALLRNIEGLRIWFFGRQSIPSDISSGSPTPDSWAPPDAFLSADDCNVDSFFSPQTLILDITLCGGWAGSDYPNSGCSGTCSQQVTNGQNYVDAQWVINYIDVYNL